MVACVFIMCVYPQEYSSSFQYQKPKKNENCTSLLRSFLYFLGVPVAVSYLLIIHTIRNSCTSRKIAAAKAEHQLLNHKTKPLGEKLRQKQQQKQMPRQKQQQKQMPRQHKLMQNQQPTQRHNQGQQQQNGAQAAQQHGAQAAQSTGTTSEHSKGAAQAKNKEQVRQKQHQPQMPRHHKQMQTQQPKQRHNQKQQQQHRAPRCSSR